jgi:hypothetical protein
MTFREKFLKKGLGGTSLDGQTDTTAMCALLKFFREHKNPHKLISLNWLISKCSKLSFHYYTLLQYYEPTIINTYVHVQNFKFKPNQPEVTAWCQWTNPSQTFWKENPPICWDSRVKFVNWMASCFDAETIRRTERCTLSGSVTRWWTGPTDCCLSGTYRS